MLAFPALPSSLDVARDSNIDKDVVDICDRHVLGEPEPEMRKQIRFQNRFTCLFASSLVKDSMSSLQITFFCKISKKLVKFVSQLFCNLQNSCTWTLNWIFSGNIF